MGGRCNVVNWEDLRQEYESTNITLKALAEKHDIKIGTLKSRKSREGWVRGSPKKDATKSKKVATLEPVIANEDLTDKQKLFCLYYIKYFNATKAYMKSYGVDRNTAESIAYRLMGNDGVKQEIQRLKNERLNGVFLDAQAVLQKYIDIAFADLTDFVEFGKKEVQAMGAFGPIEDDDGNPVMVEVNYVDFKESTEVDGTIITEVKKGKDGVSVKLADKMKALDFLAKYTDLLSENDRKKLQDEKLKMDINKTKAEIDKIQKNDDDQQEKDVAAALRGLVDGINSKAD